MFTGSLERSGIADVEVRRPGFEPGGLRKSEVLALRPEHVVWEYRAVVPRIDHRTKRTGITFFNREAEARLKYYMETERPEGAEHLGQIFLNPFSEIGTRASKRAGVKITPQVLRVWFSVKGPQIIKNSI